MSDAIKILYIVPTVRCGKRNCIHHVGGVVIYLTTMK